MVDAKPVSEPISDEEYLHRLQAAKSLQEMFAVMDSGPPEPELDIMEAVNESRRLKRSRSAHLSRYVPAQDWQTIIP